MPRIRPYEQQLPVNAGIPAQQAQGSDFGGPGLQNFGGAVVSAGRDLAHAERYLNYAREQRAETDAFVRLSEIRKAHTLRATEWAKSAAPDDTEIGERFLVGKQDDTTGSLKADLDAAIDEFREYPSAQQSLRRGAASLSEHFANFWIEKQANLAGRYAVESATRLMDNLKGTVLEDPQAYKETRDSWQSFVNMLYDTKKIDTVKKQEFERFGDQQLTFNMVRGIINAEPLSRGSADYALAQLQKGAYSETLDGDKVDGLINEATTAIRAREIKNNQLLAQQEAQRKQIERATEQSLMAKYIDHRNDPKSPPLLADDVSTALKDGKMEGPTARAILNMLDSDARDPVQRTDTSTYWDLMDKINRKFGDPKKLLSTEEIYRRAPGRLKPQDVDKLVRHFHDIRTESGEKINTFRSNFFNGIKTQITESPLGKLDRSGDEQYMLFYYLALDEEAKAEKENRDPIDIYNPKSPHYIKNKMGPFVKPIEERIRLLGEKIAPNRGEPVSEVPVEPTEEVVRQGDSLSEYAIRQSKEKPAVKPAPSSGKSIKPPRKPGETAQQYLKRIGE